MAVALADRLGSALGRLSTNAPSPTRPLALPPPGSGLRPVPGDYGLPFIGHTLDRLTNLLDASRGRYERYGPVEWGGMLGTKIVGVYGPEATEEVVANRDKAFANGGLYEYLIGPFFHRGLLLLDFGEHLHHRRIMAKAFTRPRLAGYLAAMNPRIGRTLDGWRPRPGFRVYDAAKQMTLDIATEVFVGEVPGPEQARIEKAFVDAVQGGQALVRAPVPGGLWARGLRGRRVLEDYFFSRLPARRDGDGDDLFSVLCRAESEDGHRFTDEDIVNHMIFVLMAAHDTSTITLAMMTYYLGRHPEWQDRARGESLALGRDEVGHDDLDRLSTLDLVFKETLRINAPVGALFRQAVKDTDILGYYIPRGTRIAVSTYASHRIAKWWRDPDRFDPGRFAEGRREDQTHKYAWAPFGGGAHKCIGQFFGAMEVKAVMHRMLRRFRWSVPDGYEPPMRYGTGPMPADGLPIDLRPLAG
ncbi:cytochrome P450 [Amycolatopsis thermophila]|uniref:Cytochrome P450 n=1 Tax=Amycolatopsis thermophila TaxID=206084 RepID=A0ABU0F260_9PSEU|nr:cytochrome P450 [Amycolatopsis thermophila]MDQ0381112.1 cytochrome P450 [Amycolatopsis thermophila]